MADFTITTTADFDAGTKSDSSGNYEVETVTDNPTKTANQLELADKSGDAFNFADADALTWKWENGGKTPWTNAGNLTADIDTSANDALRLATTVGGGPRVFGGRNIDVALTGEFDIRVDMDLADYSSGSAYCRIMFYVDDANYVEIVYFASTSSKLIRGNIKIGGSLSSVDYSVADLSFSFRIRRDSSNVVYVYYDVAGGDSWTQLNSGAGFSSSDGYVSLYVVSGTSSGQDITVDHSDFKINTGTFASDGYRASGNWESAAQTMSGVKVKDTTITHSGLGSNNSVDKIEWLVGGVVKATYDTNIITGSSTTIEEGDLTSGTFNDVNANFTVKVYLVGDGTTSPVITQIEGNYIKSTYQSRGNVGLFGELMKE